MSPKRLGGNTIYRTEAEYICGWPDLKGRHKGTLVIREDGIEFYVSGIAGPVIVIERETIKRHGFDCPRERECYQLPKVTILKDIVGGKDFYHIYSIVNEKTIGPICFLVSEAKKLNASISRITLPPAPIAPVVEEVRSYVRKVEKLDESLEGLKRELEGLRSADIGDIMDKIDYVLNRLSQVDSEIRNINEDITSRFQQMKSEERLEFSEVKSNISQLERKIQELNATISRFLFGDAVKAREVPGLRKPTSRMEIVSELRGFPFEVAIRVIHCGTRAIWGTSYPDPNLGDKILNLGSLGLYRRFFNFLIGSEKYARFLLIDSIHELEALMNIVGKESNVNGINEIKFRLADATRNGFGNFLFYALRQVADIRRLKDVFHQEAHDFMGDYNQNTLVMICSSGATGKIGILFGAPHVKSMIDEEKHTGLILQIIETLDRSNDPNGFILDNLVALWFAMKDPTLKGFEISLVVNPNIDEALKTALRAAKLFQLTQRRYPGYLWDDPSNFHAFYLPVIEKYRRPNRNVRVEGAVVTFTFSGKLNISNISNETALISAVTQSLERILTSASDYIPKPPNKNMKDIIDQVFVYIKTKYAPAKIGELKREVDYIMGNFASAYRAALINWLDEDEDYIVVRIFVDPNIWFLSAISREASDREKSNLRLLEEAIRELYQSKRLMEVETRGFMEKLKRFLEVSKIRLEEEGG